QHRRGVATRADGTAVSAGHVVAEARFVQAQRGRREPADADRAAAAACRIVVELAIVELDGSAAADPHRAAVTCGATIAPVDTTGGELMWLAAEVDLEQALRGSDRGADGDSLVRRYV